jgi:hypothetical protein
LIAEVFDSVTLDAARTHAKTTCLNGGSGHDEGGVSSCEKRTSPESLR